MTKLFWLSFCDTNKPSGEQFLGVCLVEPNEIDMMFAMTKALEINPDCTEPAWWLAAACTKAHEMKCNPGGQVMGVMVPEDLEYRAKKYPRNKLLSKKELEDLDEMVSVDSLNMDEK